MSVFPTRPQVHHHTELCGFIHEVLRLETFPPHSCYCECNNVDYKKCLREQNTVYTKSKINRL